MFNTTLTKSMIMRGYQCPKALWLYKYHKSSITPPDSRQEALFNHGNHVGELAKCLYPNGKEIPFNIKPYKRQFLITKAYIQEKVPAIYEASFEVDGLMCRVDILYNGPDGWELIEVKSSASKKKVNILDTAVQYYITKKTGLVIKRVKLAYINTRYIRKESIIPSELFSIIDITKDVIALEQDIHKRQKKLKNVLLRAYQCPDIPIGSHCMSPYTCDFKEHCWPKLPENNIFELSNMSWPNKFELYEEGITSLKDMPLDRCLQDCQKTQIECAINQKDLINKSALKQFLKPIFYPLVFLDFESFQTPIPPFKGMKPYEQIPFQYSVHIRYTEKGSLTHKDFLAEENEDPRMQLAKSLIKDIPKEACIVVYDAQFETFVLSHLAQLYPQYSTELYALKKNIIDLMQPFQKKWIYKPRMKGRYSIKYVLPSLDPDLDYTDLLIANGENVIRAYMQIIHTDDKAEKDRLKIALKRYCKMDTLAMAKIVDKLQQYSHSE